METKNKQPASIFNDVIGPVMIGPSSSHTAASVRIGHIVRSLAGGDAKKVVFTFSKQGSLATTYEGQGSAFGLAAGLMGMEADDPRIFQALELIKKTSIDLEFQINNLPCTHPNTYTVAFLDHANQWIHGEIISVGGGMIEVRCIQGIPVSIKGGYYEKILLLGKIQELEAQNACDHLKKGLDSKGICYDASVLCGNEETGYLIKISSSVPLEKIPEHKIFIEKQMEMTPVLPVLSQKEYQGLFYTGREMLNLAEEDHLEPWQVAVRYESCRSGLSGEAILDKMKKIIEILQNTLEASKQEQEEYPDRILGRQAYKLDTASLLDNQTNNEVIKCITLMMEAKSSMKVIVAAPTAGSCGVVPGTILGVGNVMKVDRLELAKAMLTAGLIGIVIVEHATFAGEVGGCQAECGSASGMAAAGIVQLKGGTMKQVLDAASMALQNVLGMICDPVADRVEVPCLGKNIMSGCNAIAMADLAMAGFDGVIPLDETVAAMAQIGEMIPTALKCTGQAGLSTTKTSLEIWKKLNGSVLS